MAFYMLISANFRSSPNPQSGSDPYETSNISRYQDLTSLGVIALKLIEIWSGWNFL